ncbi:hypothetical protein D3C87_990620 [compost metagenome]
MDRARLPVGDHHVDRQRRASGRWFWSTSTAVDRDRHFHQRFVGLCAGSRTGLADRRTGGARRRRGDHVRFDSGVGGRCGAEDAGRQCDGLAGDDVGDGHQSWAVAGWVVDDACRLAGDFPAQRAAGLAQCLAGVSLSAGGSRSRAASDVRLFWQRGAGLHAGGLCAGNDAGRFHVAVAAGQLGRRGLVLHDREEGQGAADTLVTVR